MPLTNNLNDNAVPQVVALPTVDSFENLQELLATTRSSNFNDFDDMMSFEADVAVRERNVESGVARSQSDRI